MEHEIQIFEHEKFGKVRVVIIDGKTWFVGKDVATALGYKDHKKVLKQHVDVEDKMGWKISTPYGVQNMTVINENGLRQLIFACRKKEAHEFWDRYQASKSTTRVENFKLPAPVEWAAQRVLTTSQLAECYKCKPRNISDNFNRAKDYFVEGVHYLKLEGEALRTFRDFSEKNGLVLSTNTPTLYLWTYQGCVRHCKMINSNEAWKIFDDLEKFYFKQAPAEPAPEPAPAKNARSEAQKLAAVVYVLLLSNGLIKIGHSGKICARIATIKRQTKSTVEKIYTSLLMPRDIARQIERLCLENFSSRRVEGEFFSVPFEEACAAVNIFAKNLYVLPQFMNFIAVSNNKIVDRKIN